MGNPYFFKKKTDFTIVFADPIFPIYCTTFVELYMTVKMGDLCEKPHFTI